MAQRPVFDLYIVFGLTALVDLAIAYYLGGFGTARVQAPANTLAEFLLAIRYIIVPILTFVLLCSIGLVALRILWRSVAEDEQRQYDRRLLSALLVAATLLLSSAEAGEYLRVRRMRQQAIGHIPVIRAIETHVASTGGAPESLSVLGFSPLAGVRGCQPVQLGRGAGAEWELRQDCPTSRWVLSEARYTLTYGSAQEPRGWRVIKRAL